MPYLTNETVFDLDQRPAHMIVIGGGPIGIELAQAHRRLGARVTVLARHAILGKDDPEIVGVVRRRLIGDGVALYEDAAIVSVERQGNGIAVTFDHTDARETVAGSHLLVAAGRRANTAGLDLEVAEIQYSSKGIDVDTRLRTINKKIFAIGDVAGGLQFTHMAAYQAGIVIRNALFHLPAKSDESVVPWVTYSDPELAHVGLNEAQAGEKFGGGIRVLTWPFADNDRALTEDATDGLIKIVVGRKGHVLGASIGGAHAGELILTWVLAIRQGLKIGAIANLIAPYPTLSEVSKRAAGTYYTPSLFSNATRKLVRALQCLP